MAHRDGLLLRLSVALYRGVLLRYPAEQRARYGDEMRLIFETEARAASERGGVRGLAAVWWRTLRDAARPLPGPVGVGESRKEEGTMGGGLAGGWTEDLRYAWRSLVREPRFTGLVIGVLGVGMALNISAFAVFNVYLLRPLPFPDADRIVSVRNGDVLSWTEVDRWFERAVSWDLDVFTIVGAGHAEMARGQWVTPDFLDTYGIEPALGRGFLPEEAGRYAAPVALISQRLWQERFGGEPDVVGQSFAAYTADRPDHAETFTIVGVLPADLWWVNGFTDVIAPIRDERAIYGGRLRPGLALADVEAELTALAIERMEHVPEGFSVQLRSLQEQHTAAVRPTLVVLQVAVLLVLVIACANAAVLMLIRSSRRHAELAVRRALGASAGRLARQLLMEGGALAAAAAGIGVLLAIRGLDLTRMSAESHLGRSIPGGAEALALDGAVLTATLGLALAVGVGFGIVPLVAGLPGAVSIRQRGGTESRGRRRLRTVMVTAEVALSLALLTGAGLMVRSALHLQQRELGLDPHGVVQATLGLRDASHPDAADRVRTFIRLRDRLSEVPGIASAGLGSMGLFTTGFNSRNVESDANGTGPAAAVRWTVDEAYFATLGVEIVAGRGFSEQDAAGSEPVAVVSRTLDRSLFGDSGAVGRRLRMAAGDDGMGGRVEPGEWHRIVGVVADVAREVGGDGSGDVYFPVRQSDPRYMNAVIRTRPGSIPSIAALAEAVAEIDPEVPFATPRRLEEVVAEDNAPTRYVATLLGAFSAFALLLSVLGLYGVVSYAARAQRRDVAIRVALGADRGRVTSLFLRHGMAMVGTGIVVGSGVGLLLARALAGQLHGVRPGDPATHLSLAAVLALAAAAAVWFPSRRAASSDPMEVLREDG